MKVELFVQCEANAWNMFNNLKTFSYQWFPKGRYDVADIIFQWSPIFELLIKSTSSSILILDIILI